MSEPHRTGLEACVRRARRRLQRNESLRRLFLWAAAASALLFLILAMATLGLEAGAATLVLPLAVLAGGALHAAGASVSERDAAIFIDRRSGTGDVVSSALSGPGGEVGDALRRRAEAICGDLDVGWCTRFVPSRLGRAVPVILVLCLSLGVASGARDGPTPAGGAPVAGGPPPSVGGEARALVAEVERTTAEPPDLPGRLQKAYRDLEEIRGTYGEVRSEVLSDPVVEKALEEGRIRVAELDPQEAERARDALERAASRLPDGSEARSAARAARDALDAGSDVDLLSALGRLAELLRDEGGDSLDEVSSEIRRIAAQRGVSLPPWRAATGIPPGEEPEGIPLTGESLERVMDREDVPWRYRETVRRYFERRGEESR